MRTPPAALDEVAYHDNKQGTSGSQISRWQKDDCNRRRRRFADDVDERTLR